MLDLVNLDVRIEVTPWNLCLEFLLARAHDDGEGEREAHVRLLDGVTPRWRHSVVLFYDAKLSAPHIMRCPGSSCFCQLLALYIYRLGAGLGIIFFVVDDARVENVTPLAAVHLTRALRRKYWVTP